MKITTSTLDMRHIAHRPLFTGLQISHSDYSPRLHTALIMTLKQQEKLRRAANGSNSKPMASSRPDEPPAPLWRQRAKLSSSGTVLLKSKQSRPCF
jgi:hypothetical protein